MKYCLKCNKEFPTQVFIEEKKVSLSKRKYCLDCSPYKSNNRKQLHLLINENNIKVCQDCNKEYVGGSKKLKDRCNTCASVFYRNRVKIRAIEYKGGACSCCGYKKCISALQFHHVNQKDKDFTIGNYSFRKFESLIDELDKCILVCANCHSEIHSGLIDAFKIFEEQKLTLPKYIVENSTKIKKESVPKISKRPSKEILEKLVWEISCVKIGELYGVSDNAVNKWCKFYGIKKPGRGEWEKIKASNFNLISNN